MANDIEQLEEKLAFQEDTLQKLDDALASQQQQILLLEHQVKLLGEQLRKVEDASVGAAPAGAAPADEKPPHY